MKVNEARATRLLVYMPKPHRRALKILARRTGSSQQALIREAIAKLLKQAKS